MQQYSSHNGVILPSPVTLGMVRSRALTTQLLFICVVVLGNLTLAMSGLLGDAAELEALASQNLTQDPILVSLLQFIVHPVVASQLLIGLCWLLFHVFIAKRAGIILRKETLSLSAPTRLQPVQDAHGCRAPPVVAG
ncbi:hypothetical protein [Pseudoalteromonas sp. GB56]